MTIIFEKDRGQNEMRSQMIAKPDWCQGDAVCLIGLEGNHPL